MSNRLTPKQKRYHDELYAMPEPWRDKVVGAFRSLVATLEEDWGRLPRDDRAEALLADITRFVQGH